MMDVKERVEGKGEGCKMEVKLIEKSGNEMRFLVTNLSVSLANALRRAILTLVNVAAIEDVTIYKNTSSMYDEVLALRLGLIPLKTVPTDKKSSKKIRFLLKEVGPKIVHASDMKVEDPDFAPVYDKTIIMELKRGEEIDLEAEAAYGNGLDHAKFVPAHVFYHFYPIIDIKDSDVKNAKEIAKKCPVNILEAEGGKLSVKKGSIDKCILCKACEDFAGKDVIEISSDPKKIIFEIESWGQLSVKDIIDEAVSGLNSELDMIEEKVL